MSDTVYHLIKRDERKLAEIFETFSQMVGLASVEVTHHQFGEIETVLAVYEQYYFRTGSYATVTLSMIANGEGVLADIIGSGGGSGILNISLGANADMAYKIVQTLKQIGFVETH